MPAIARRPREGIQHDAYPFETLHRDRQPIQIDQMELTMGRMGELPNTTMT